MLPRAFTAVIERNVTFDGAFTTEPYETAWAGDARWFVHVLDATPGAEIEFGAQVSPESLTWCDHESRKATIKGKGMASIAVDLPGPWQRLSGTVHNGSAKVIVYLSLRG